MLTTIAIIGSDSPAAGWAARALAYGLDVLAAPGADLAPLRAGVDAAWPALEALGLLPGARRDRLRCAASLAELAQAAQLIVLCGAPGDGLFVRHAEHGTRTSADERGRKPAIRVHPRSSASAAPNGEQVPNDLPAQLDALAPAETPLLIAQAAGSRAPQRAATSRLLRAYAAEPSHLLPLAELHGAADTAPAAFERAEALLRAIGLEPLRVAPGGLAGRLLAALEAATRELAAEGHAPAAIDAALALGPGLLAPLAGAPAGLRDEALIAIMRTLRQYGLGAGRAVAAHEARRYTSRAHQRWQPGQPIAAPLELHAGAAEPAWIDYNGHMTESSYLAAFGDASDALFRYVGIDEAYRAAGGSFYTVETHINYYREVGSGEPLRFTTQLLALDAKRLHLFHSMLHGVTGALLCTTEQLLLHVDTRAGAAGPIAPEVHAALSAIVAAHTALPVPSQVGRRIGIRRQQ